MEVAQMKKNKSNVKNNAYTAMLKKDFKINKSLYIMVLPVIVFYLLFHYVPMYGAIIAFKNFKPQLGIWGSSWVGLKHFMDFFNGYYFLNILGNTLRISFATLIFGFPAPIILALLLNELRNAKFAKIIQNFTYMPHFISLVVICGLIRNFTADSGVIPYLLSFFGVEPKSLLNYPQYFVPIYVISNIWQEVGWGSIIYLAALTNVDASLYEAAVIDGANKWKQLIHITIPSIMPTIVIMLIMRVGNILNVGFEKILLLYNGSTLDVADVISTYVYRKGLLDLSWSFSTAVGLFNSVINFIFLVGMNSISKRVNEVGLW
ncbi:MAG: sugar ABC transporter permease [Clostridia bacterium]|nr:sugar ABC transporter permease [Clostridia bacterium]